MAHILRGVLVVFLIATLNDVDARDKSPLIEEDATRSRNKAAECVFGKQVKELHSQWIPDLGVPIGVLYCMKCECIPFRRKRRVVARVQCRSIKNECPEPTCEEPVLLPGRCCKTCPGDTYNPDVIQDIVPQNVIDEEEKYSKHFAALLSTRSSLVLKNDDLKPVLNDINKNNVVATGRFTFLKKSLYYSFVISEKAARPRSLQFVDGDGTILEEFILSGAGGYVNSVYQNSTRKVCGVWRRLPRDYRRLLKDEKMFVVLVWGVKDQAEFTLSGQVKKYVALATEMFSSLLEPAPGTNSILMAGAGGTAIVSTSITISPSVHIAVIFNGIFAPGDISDIPVEVTLSLDEKKQIILREEVRVTKPAYELNLIEFSSPVSVADLRLLTRGRLVISVTSMTMPEALRLSGNVITKATCELYQTALSSSPTERNANPYGVSGLAWLYLNNEGSLVYNIQVDGVHSEQKPVYVVLTDVKRRSELEDLTPSFHNGWANGTVEKLSPKVLESLSLGNVAVHVSTQTDNNLIRGRLTAKLVAEARDAPQPILLKREDYTLPNSAVGIAWISVDDDCHVHYDVTLTGIGGGERQLQLYLELLPMIAPGAPVITRFLDNFQANQVEGSPTETLTKEELNRLDTGVVFVKVKDKVTRNTLLAATLKQVKVPQTCLPHYTDNDVPSFSPDLDITQNGVCLHEGKFYQEEAQWTSTLDPCMMCFCQNGNVKCDTMTCPNITCGSAHKVKVPGECCQVCSNSSSVLQESNTSIPRGCTLGGRFYSAGSKFHPFMIPHGFDMCTECFCDPLMLETKCTRVANEKLCNKNTFEPRILNDDPVTITVMTTARASSTKSAQQIIAEGGCRNLNNPTNPHVNGSEYHPFIDSLGEYKCVTCKCRNGNQTCERLPCSPETCQKMLKTRRNNAKKNASSEYCCSWRDCRKFRHKNKNHKMQHRNS